MHVLRYLSLLVPLAACAADTNDVAIQLAPDVISSLDGRLGVRAQVFRDRDLAEAASIQLAVEYVDRNGTAHAIAPIDGVTDDDGAFETTIEGLTWDGTGSVTATVMEGASPVMLEGGPLAASATFAVLDRSPPVATIVAPANGQVSADQGTSVEVHVTDEIGISQVMFEWSGFRGRERTLVASGATDVTVRFDVDPQDIQIGQTIMLYALAEDLSGNQGAAMPISVQVVQ